MPGHECYHCKQWVEEGDAHDCWTTTEAALTKDLSEDLRDAWVRLRETAIEFGEQRVYASHHSIMFSRKSCYFFVRPKRKALEVCIFLGRAIRAPQVRRVEPASKAKLVHFVDVTHRDQVESPITDWLREAFDYQDQATTKPVPPGKKPKSKPAASRKAAAHRKAKPKPKPRPRARTSSTRTRSKH